MTFHHLGLVWVIMLLRSDGDILGVRHDAKVYAIRTSADYQRAFTLCKPYKNIRNISASGGCQNNSDRMYLRQLTKSKLAALTIWTNGHEFVIGPGGLSGRKNDLFIFTFTKQRE